MNYYIYETENLINGKKYIGKRCTDRSVFNDYYLGSGINLNKAIEKYGKENFRKQILEICSSKKELSEKEKQYGEKFECIADVTKKYGIDRHKIIDSCRNKRKSGILINDLETHWKYID